MASGETDTGKDLAKEDKTENDIMQSETQLLIQLQNQIKTVDKNVVTLINSFDQLHDTEKKRSQIVEEKSDTHNYDNEMEFPEGLKTTGGRMSQLLDQVNAVEIVQTNVLKSLSKLIRIIQADSGEMCTKKLPDKCELQTESQFLDDAWVEMLQGENSRLRERNTLYREHAALVHKRAESVCAERDLLRKELDSLRRGKTSYKNSDFEKVCKNDNFDCGVNTDAHVEQNIRTNTCGMAVAPTSTNASSELTAKMADDKNIEDLPKALERIDELKTSLLKTQQSLANKEELLKTVHLDEAYEVDVINYTTDDKSRYIEDCFVGLLKKKKVKCNVVKGSSTRTYDAKNVLLILCIAYTKDSWDKALENAKQIFPEHRSVAIVLIYNGSRADSIQLLEDVQKKHVESISNTTFSIKYHQSYNYKYQFHDDKELAPLIEYIYSISSPKTKVVGCPACVK